jgi:CheY-like chemotaxis protein
MTLDIDEEHPQYERLKSIEQHVRLGADLTKQLLGFARGGKYEANTTDVNKLVRNSSEMFGRTKKEISIHSKYHEDLGLVELDRGQMEHVLLNLYVNAWQAMPEGGKLYIETDNITLDEHYVKPYKVKPGRYVKISIADTGIGMDKATQQRIFEPFFTTKEMGRGTGLGLASVYGIVKNHGGYINVYSEKEKGTIFKIYLPASEKKIPEKMELSEKVVKGTGTLLLVDDEDRVIDVGEQMLKTLGYSILVARSGKEAIEIYKDNQDRVDMVILDMIMSDMSGGETYDRLKEISPGIKVLLSSGYSIEGQATEILNRGCNGFIQKPFSMSELSEKIGNILARG